MTLENLKEKSRLSLRTILRALKYKNYRLFFGGQIISLTGTWMQQVAVSWLVYRLTNDAFLLGVVGFSSQIPTFLVSPFAGVIADRISRHKILIATQTLSMLQAIGLVFLFYNGSINVLHVIILNSFLGLINGFDIPVRQAFVVEMVDKKEDLGNAIALNSMMFNAARLIGPSAAGLLIAALGEGLCFLLNGVSYIAVIIALLAMKINFTPQEKKHRQITKELKEGLSYTWKFKPIRVLLMLVGLVSLTGMPYVVLMPIFARDILGGGSDTLGFLLGAVGIGALIGAVFLASRKTVLGLGKIIRNTTTLFGIVLILFSLSREFLLSQLLMVGAGFSVMVQMSSSNTIIQTLVDDDKRGRVMAFYTMAFMGTMPLGSLIAGSFASKIGAPFTLIVGGVFCLLGASAFAYTLPALRKIVRPIYMQMGIIKEVADGLQSATNMRVPPQG